MPVELGIWKIGDSLQRIAASPLDQEERLEDFLVRDPALIDPSILIIGRQVLTGFGKRIDLLGINADGEIIVIELKRDATPRDVVAQTLDYGSWVKDLSYEEITDIYREHACTRNSGAEPVQFEEAFSNKFGMNPPETLNEKHRLIVVASGLDPSTERIIAYLVEQYAVPINAVFFQYFRDGDGKYLTRTWLREPSEFESVQSRPNKREPWNGQDYYVSFGDGERRAWEDAIRFGFVSGGGGRWYSRTLGMLSADDRVFVCIPGTGYVGVGIVKEGMRGVGDYTVQLSGRVTPILNVPLKAPRMGEYSGDPELSEYLVRVDWIKTLPKAGAIWEAGMFANQNTVCRLRNRFTLERLLKHFELES